MVKSVRNTYTNTHRNRDDGKKDRKDRNSCCIRRDRKEYCSLI